MLTTQTWRHGSATPRSLALLLAGAVAGVGGCAAPCVDDGFGQKLCPEDDTSTGGATISAGSTDAGAGAGAGSGASNDSGSGSGAGASDGDGAGNGAGSDDATAGLDGTSGTAGLDDTGATGTTGGMMFCTDADGDGFGDPTDCTTADDPPPGTVPNDEDCDDNAADAFPGAAENEDPDACMQDEDDDGWGDSDPPPGVTPGTDCDDASAATFVGAAPNDDAAACMKDEDDDDWGDDTPPMGVTPGTDCDDTSDTTFVGAAETEDAAACMNDDDDDGWGDSDPPPGVSPGADCYDADDRRNPDDHVLIAVDSAGEIFSVNVTDASTALFAQLDISGFGGFDVISADVLQDGRIIGTNSPQQELVTLDVAPYCADGMTPGTATPFMTGHGTGVCGLAVPADGNLYGLDNSNEAIVQFDLSDGSIAQSNALMDGGSPMTVGVCGMAYDCVDDRILFSDGSNGDIYEVDPSNGNVTLVADTSDSWVPNGFEYDPVTKTALIAADGELFRVPLDASGMSTKIGDFGRSVNDLTFVPGCTP